MAAKKSNPAGEVLLRDWGFRMTHQASEAFTIDFLSYRLRDLKCQWRNTQQSWELAHQSLNQQRPHASTSSSTHRMVWVGRDISRPSSPTPCHGQGHLHPDQGAQSPVQPGLEWFQGWGISPLSGQPGPGSHHPQRTNTAHGFRDLFQSLSRKGRGQKPAFSSELPLLLIRSRKRSLVL